VISVDLARRLEASGLQWAPAEGDRFFIPDRNLDDEVFAIADMTVGVRRVQGGMQIAFNGAVEWALDAIMQHEVVWLPSEWQLRDRLGARFVALRRIDYGYRCDAVVGDAESSFEALEAAEAYGLALLAVMEAASV